MLHSQLEQLEVLETSSSTVKHSQAPQELLNQKMNFPDVPILEWEKAICTVHPQLKKYHEKYPENDMLRKWVIDDNMV